jgi:hypothetical protein
MNIKHSVNAPFHTGSRSFLRRAASVAIMGALMLGVASASADGGGGKGSFVINTIAGVGDGYTGKLDVKGDGKFSVKDEGAKLVFVSRVVDGELNMKDGRQEHTVGPKSKLGLVKKDHVVTLTIEKSKLTFPEAGKEASGSAPGTLMMLGKEQKVTVKYTVKEEGGKYVIKNASFDFDYTKHVADGKKVCLMLVCVKPTVNISITNGVVEAKK